MNLLQEYKDLYYKEIEHSDRLNIRISTSLTLLTIIGTAEAFIINESISKFSLSWYSIVLSLLCLINSFTFFQCIYSFYKTYRGFDYSYFPIKGMTEYIEVINQDESIINKENEITEMLKYKFSQDAINNRQENYKKNMSIRRLIIWIFRAFIFIIISFIFWAIMFNCPLINI